tara:strand:- start:405 stop:569 length:165 start_codon:yes stop_codon:yes gene_type:complete
MHDILPSKVPHMQPYLATPGAILRIRFAIRGMPPDSMDLGFVAVEGFAPQLLVV